MDSEFVTLAQSYRLEAAGFPQDQWPQMVWWLPGPHSDFNEHLTYHGRLPPSAENDTWDWHWRAAPTYLHALDWLRGRRHDFLLERLEDQSWQESASALLDAVLTNYEEWRKQTS